MASKLNLFSIYPIVDIQDHLVLANNGNALLAYRLELPEIYTLSEKDYEELHGAWFQALKTLPAGTIVHKQDLYRKRVYEAENLKHDTFLEQATYAHFKGREYLSHDCYVFFILPKLNTMSQSQFINPFKTVANIQVKQLDDKLQQFIKTVSESVAGLNAHKKLNFIPLKAPEIHTLTIDFFNGYNSHVDTDLILDQGHAQIGDHFFDVLAINSELCFDDAVQTSKQNPLFTSDEFTFHQGFIEGIGLQLHGNHMINQMFYLDDRQVWRKHLDKKVEELQKSANFGSQNKVILEKIQEILHQINADDQARIIRGQLNVVYWDKSLSDLDRLGTQIKTEFKELEMTPYYPKGEARKNYLLNSYCCFASNFSNTDLYVTDLKHALCLLIQTSNYRSDPQGILFNERCHNLPVFKDVWDESKKRIKARNFAVFAPTGEGKSFLANNILRQYFESGVRLVIIDLGGSYTKFAKLYPNDHTILRYETGRNLGINPFYISKDSDLGPERLEDLSIFLSELFAANAAPNKAETVALKKILAFYYQNVAQEHSLESLYHFIESQQKDLLKHLKIHEDYFNITNFLHIISEYVGDGLYSFLFKVTEDQTYKLEDKRLIVFELDEVKNNKEILSVMLKLIKSAIQRTIWKNRSERGIILFDEFAKQLKFDNVLESVEFYYQAIRKQNGAIGIILQSINQLPNTATSASILENTQIIYSLNNEKGYDDLQQRLKLSQHDLNQLKSIKNNLSGPLKYTEMFIKIGRESNVFRLEVPASVYAAYLTDGPENDAIMALYENYGCMEKAITAYTNKNQRL
ncbi:TraG family conjugative transposon ATPase [Formosa sp. A9]|uniref:TraG family conjugative transposon ATPase n=1 Tax=Formosa sp. A9 TaxID=3442641 RepID=UPI003EC0C6DD